MLSIWKRIPLAWRLALDAAMLLAMVILSEPHGLGDRATSIAVHEWLGIAIAPVILVHLTLNWGWIVQTTRKLASRLPTETRVNQVLNLLQFAVMAVAVWSGIEVSESALPAIGLARGASFAWREVHEVSSNLSMVLVGAHAALHWKWIARTTRRVLGLPARQPVHAVAGAR